MRHPGRGKPGKRLGTLFPVEDDLEDGAPHSEARERAPARDDLRKLPLLAPLADEKKQ
jgi:hypothetical protein